MPQIEVNDTQLYYEIHGPEDKDVIVLSNGVLMSTASWALQVPTLSKYFRVLTYDCRGMWQSAHPSGPYTMRQHAEDLAALLDTLGIEKAHIAGISYGSEVSMTFALHYPEKTQSLIVADGVSYIGRLLRAQCDTWIAAAEKKDAKLLLQVTTPFNFSEDWIIKNEKLIESLEAKYEVLDFEAFLELMKCFYNLNITDELENIQAPTLVIVAEGDLLKTRSYSDLIAEKIPNAELVVVPGSGHALSFEQPGAFNTLVLGFVLKNMGE